MIEVRPELPKDYGTMWDVNVLAFDNRENEARLVETIRSSADFSPDLSLVAEMDGKVVGHILFSEISISGGSADLRTLALAPMAVRPAWQRQGIGSMLVREGLKRSADCGFALVAVIGHPRFYPRFGFVKATPMRLRCRQFNVTGDDFMSCELVSGSLDGAERELCYPAPFVDV